MSSITDISDWLLRLYCPTWLRAAGLPMEADFLGGQKPIDHIKDVHYLGNDLRGIAMNVIRDWDSGLLKTGLICRDVARAAGSVAVWNSGWPEISTIAFSVDCDIRTMELFLPPWMAMCSLTRYCSWVIGRNASAEIAGQAGINSLLWSESFVAAEAALMPAQRNTKSAAQALIKFHESQRNGKAVIYEPPPPSEQRSGPDDTC